MALENLASALATSYL